LCAISAIRVFAAPAGSASETLAVLAIDQIKSREVQLLPVP
jgi:hypothetical protein